MTNQFPEALFCCVIIDTCTSQPWKTPKGKWQWAKPRFAAAAFNFHTGKKIRSMPALYEIHCARYEKASVSQSV